ncbi:2-iminoacetate synthase [Chitinophaga skermanii]|uniref:2-iminoacetate synthase n=1 Tax=Chitinophaga skermanii TaxID=331697 RepID=A0A327QCE3_9BACT|nr:2-iminoacetate synthase ThiH [Chitinophaga skermanii]RAJ01538.1 2-iminoacetate synthase [Chitinophaga skermanii]
MMQQPTFERTFRQHDWEQEKATIYTKSQHDVLRALRAQHRTLEDFKALISPAAAPYLSEMATMSGMLTRQRFGNTVQLYIPLYLSNECQNICSYCGFSLDNEIPRKTLSGAEILKEIEVIKSMGYEHVLLVTGESNREVGMDYFEKILPIMQQHFSNISMEVQPLDQPQYETLRKHGVNAVLVYQETYHEADYKKHHPKGKKSNFAYRLETPDRLGRAGMHKIGLGVLIGLEDWRTDSFFTALHVQYLQKTYWKTRYSLSFPRLRPFSGGLAPKVDMSDRELIQLICAYRLCFPEIELSISTREEAKFRDHIFKVGITAMSAGSKTNPGGYTSAPESLEQFEISDDRPANEIAGMLKRAGYEAVWKDWSNHYID